MNRNRLALLAAFALLPACNLSPGGTSDDDDAVGDDDDAGGGALVTTIQAINAGEHDEDALLTIEGAIVSGTYVTDDNFVTFWIQDDLGGPGGGLTISTFVDVIEEADPEEAMYLGDIIDITGRFQLAFAEEIPRLSVDQASSLTITGYTDLPDATLVEVEEITGGFADRSLWGLPVVVADVVVETRPTFENYGVFEADGIEVDDVFYWPDVEVGDELEFLGGILTPWYSSITLMPRWDDDVWFEPAGCDAIPATKNGDTIQDLNCRRYFEGETVSVDGLTVIAGETNNPGSFFVQDLASPLFGGVLVYDPKGNIPAVGAIVDLSEGEYSEYLGQTEVALWDGSVTDTGNSAKIEALEVLDPCSVSEAHEGTLITLPEVVVTEQTEWDESHGFYPVDGCPGIMVGSIFYDSETAFDAENGGVGTITNLTGVVSDRFELLLINPRSSDDWDAWTPAAE